jgi:hypothetical protein
MGAIKKFIELKIQSKIGVNATVIIGLLVALLATVVAFVFALVTAFIWLADRYSSLTAGLIVFGLFTALAVIGAVVAISAHRAAAASAEKALAKQSTLALVQPTHLKTALQVASGIGWRRVVPVVGVGFLAAGLVRELSMRRRINRDAAY